ncbi:MAG: hypothetical protein WEB07_00620 [Natronospirillum sp.]
MRSARRFLFRDQQCVEQLNGSTLARTRESVRVGLLWRTYIALLQGLCQSYRLTRPNDPERASLDSVYLDTLQAFNPDLGDLQLILASRQDSNHWLYQLIRCWQYYWQSDSTLFAEQGLSKPGESLIAVAKVSDEQSIDCLDEIHAGLLAWTDLFEQHHQMN